MGVDATIFVLAGNGFDNIEFTEASFRLVRNRELWPLLEAMPARGEPCVLCLPQGAWSGYSDGTRPAEAEGCELGYLACDSYNNPLRLYDVRDLPDGGDDVYAKNAAIFALIKATWPERQVTIVWH